MIIIDGRQSEMQVANFSNLEEILLSVMGDADMENRIVTDVFVNDAQFTEIYPHQAEDVGSKTIDRVEVRSVPVNEMAMNISDEMYKVINIMTVASKEIAGLFRQADDTEGLELLQDLLDVTRSFMGTVDALRTQFDFEKNEDVVRNTEKISELLAEMSEVLEDEDWILFADLLEYEFLPTCNEWTNIIQMLQENIKKTLQ